MRIGEASKRSGVPVSTIRYYIRRGLIVPDGEGPQYLFDEQDCHTLERIVQFKKWGLSLETAHRLLSLERVSSGVEQDTVEDCVALLRTHQKQLEDQRVRYQHYKEEINEFIDELNRQAAAPHGSALAPTGVPLRALSLLCCPRCGGAFQISKADMDMSAIFPPTSTVAAATVRRSATGSSTPSVRKSTPLTNRTLTASCTAARRASWCH